MVQTATFIFYDNLNDFLPRRQKGKPVVYHFNGKPAVKDGIEAIGIPHVAVAEIVINETKVDQMHPLQYLDEVQVYPLTAQLDDDQQTEIKFIADVHCGKLTKALRMLGLDVVYQNNYDDATIASIAAKENRIVLTRDVGLLKHKKIMRGYWLRSQQTDVQLQEVLRQYGLLKKLAPLSRCLVCNGLINEVQKDIVADNLPTGTQQHFNQFYQCSQCQKVYWKGSHYEQMKKFIAGFKK